MNYWAAAKMLLTLLPVVVRVMEAAGKEINLMVLKATLEKNLGEIESAFKNKDGDALRRLFNS